MNLRGNTVFITGGGSGIGRGLAEAFHKQGNKVIIGGRRAEVLSQTAATNPGMEFIVLDTTNLESIKSAAVDLPKRFPDLNVVINNAGVQRLHDFSSDDPLDERSMREEIDTNVYGVIRTASEFLPHLKKRPQATLINVSSGLAFLPIARYPIYCATKAFVHSFTLSLREQLKGTSVRVIELAPPWVKTDLDSTHGRETTHEGMSPMPLQEFIAAAMDELASGKDTLPVAAAKFLYAGGISDRSEETFAKLNR